MASQRGFSPPLRVERDLRLDLFPRRRVVMIYLDHIPDDVVSWLTLRNYGFSDAAEVFVFISGYLAGYIYGPIISTGHFLAAIKRLLKRVAEMYVAHIMLFLMFTAQIARTARRFDNPMLQGRVQRRQFPRPPRHPDRAGADAALQAGRPRRAAALYRAGGRLSADPVEPVAPPQLDLAGLGRALRAGALVRLESPLLSARHKLVLQSVCLAIAVRIRGMVRRRGPRQDRTPDPVPCGPDDCLCLACLCLRDRHDLARPPGWKP